MPAGDSTLASLPPQPLCLVSGASAKVWKTSSSSPHFAQRYSYVGIAESPGFVAERVSTRYLRVLIVAEHAARAEWVPHARDRPVRPARLAPRNLPERAARGPGARPRHLEGGVGEPRRLQRRPAARMAGGRARASLRLREGRDRGRG